MVTLYRKHANGVGTWRIFQVGNMQEAVKTLTIQHATVMGGSMVTHTEVISQGLGGRTIEEQCALRMTSRISRMLDKGYKYTLEEAKAGDTNQLGLIRPMLARAFDKIAFNIPEGSLLQDKLDGHRCLIVNDGGEIRAYSRQGKPIESISHILDEVRKHLPDGMTIDGELYRHGVPLQTLASWIKRKQPETEKIRYHVYDIVSDDDYRVRHEELLQLFCSEFGYGKSPVKVVPCIEYESNEQIFKLLHERREEGFEGIMIRLPHRPYEPGKRSTSLIKVKAFLDDDFECIDIVPSPKGQGGVCILKARNGSTFRTSAPGSIIEKVNQLNNKMHFIGSFLTVQYSTLTRDGIPFHPAALRWREDV